MRLFAALTGFTLLTAGLWAAWPPLAGIVVGALLLAFAIYDTLEAQRRPPE